MDCKRHLFPLKISLIILFLINGMFLANVQGQTSNTNHLYLSNGDIDGAVYKVYEEKTKSLLLSYNINAEKYIADVVPDHSQLTEFKKYISFKILHNKRELVIKVAEDKIKSKSDLENYFIEKQKEYIALFPSFKNAQKEIAANELREKSEGGGVKSPIRGPGQPCNNMDFETHALGGWVGSYGSSQDPTFTAGFNLGAINSTNSEHTIMTAGADCVIPTIPCVMPGGGTASLRLGDCAQGGLQSARISQTFLVNAASPYFMYNYAAVIQDGGAGHTAPIQPYFQIRMYAGVDNTAPAISCASLDINGTSAAALGLTLSAGSYYYKNWTQVLIPLNAYAGTNVTIEFTVSDCMGGIDALGNPAPGSHDAWAYIDCSCNPPEIVTSSSTLCGGGAITLTAPGGVATYSWAGPGIVGPSTTPAISANVAGTYTVTMTTITSPPNTPCTFSLDTIIPGSPANPVASFTSNVVCVGLPTVFTDASTPVGSITSWAWDFNGDGVTDATTQNPTHTFPAAGTYPVTLTVTMGPCNSTITINAIVNPGTPPAITPAGPFCANAAATTLIGTPAGGTWSGTGITNTATGAFNPAIATVGNNTITYTTIGACGGTITAIVVVNPNPVTTVNSPTICPTTSAILTAAGATTYLWSTGAVINPITVTPAATTSYTVTGTSLGCTSSAISTVTVTGSLTPTVNSPAICAGATTTLTATGGTTYTWSNGSVINPTTVTPATTTSYTVTANTGGCTGTAVATVTVNPVPVLTITNPAPVCAPLTVDITAAAVTAGSTGAGVLTYWTDAAATIPLATPSAVSTSGTYYILSTATGACTDIMPVVVTINPLPVSDAGPDITICTATTGNIGTATTAGDSYSWASTIGLSSSTISNPTVTLTNGTAAPVTSTYTVTTTITATGCLSTDQVNVTVNPLATANAGPPQTICVGTTATLAGTVGGAAISGTWGGGSGTYSPNNTVLNAVYTPSAAENAAGSVTLTLVSNDPAGPCPVATSTMTITINPIATINAGPDQTICIGGTAALAGSIGGATTIGTWTGGAGTYSTSNTDPLAVYTPSAAEAAAGSVTLTFTSDDPIGPCGAVSDMVIITIAALPSANAGLDQTICDGTTATLAGVIGGAATSATWSGGTGTYTPSSTTLNAVYTPSAAEAAAGTVNLTLTTNDPAGPCTFATDNMVITINPIATINAGPDQTICIGTTATLAGVIGGSATTGTWSGGTGTYAPSAATATAVYTPSAAENAAGTVTLTFTSDDPIGPCAAVSDQMVITINQLPTANAGTPQSVCVGSTITLAGAIGGSATSGTWSGGAGSFTPSATTLNAVYNPTAAEYAAGIVTLTLTTNDPVGPCTFSTSTVTLNFYQTPVVLFTVDVPSGCPVHCVHYTDLSTVIGGFILSRSWDFGDGTTDIGNDSTPAHCYANTGSYTVTLTVVSNHGCTSTLVKPAYITVFPVPVAQFNPTPTDATIEEPVVTLNNQSSADVSSWFYYFGDGDSISPNVPSPGHSYPNVVASTYTATLIVENTFGCWDTVQHEVIIGPEFTFYIPNAFTPNGDGTNDYFYGHGVGIVDYDLYIFDRWGNMIFHGHDLNDMWDGRANGGSDVAQQDVYVWKVKLTDVFGKKHDYIGTVTIVK